SEVSEVSERDTDFWKCSCGASNQLTMEACAKCYKAKEDLPSRKEFIDSDDKSWESPFCDGMNESYRDSCFNCMRDKDDD
ncbi:MAG: hypothetical protein KAJ73_10060, partial [Zetaproteobacteria bacterium]|nr:hypothetical protein [Zetaproteobacteria bacterium]